MLKTRIAVLVSGGGTNLQALLDAQRTGMLKSGVIALVVSDRPNIYALCRAQDAGALGVIEDRTFHASIADACANDYWRKVVQTLARPIEVAIGVTRSNEALSGDLVRAVDEEHGAIRDAIAAGDPEQARAAAVRHMECSTQRILNADRAFWSAGGGGISRLDQVD